jgi:predicted dehydrogenase
MLNRNKIRVGIVGANPRRGFASIAHIPALQALADFEISAVCTTRQDSADAAAKHFGVPLAFSDAEKLARHTDVDLVTVSEGARSLPAHHGRNRGREACLL